MRIGFGSCLIEEFVYFRILVIGIIIQDRRRAAAVEERTQTPVGFRGRVGPADQIELMLTVGRCLGAVNERALTGFKRTGLDMNADLSELLLQELQRFERLAVVVGRPERRMEALREARFLQKFGHTGRRHS